MRTHIKLFTSCLAITLLSGCAMATKPMAQMETPSHSTEAQRQAQQAATAVQDVPTLKRKLALGNITNETTYGRSLLAEGQDNRMANKVNDMLSKALTESQSFLVFERPEISGIENEAKLMKTTPNLVGVDSLIIGSLTEFGRKTVGKSGFLSDTKRQIAYAKLDLRLVDTDTGHVYFAVSGAGEASNESSGIAGFGSRSSYDGLINDKAIQNAVSDAVDKLTVQILSHPWQTDVLDIKDSTIYMAAGKSQGIKLGDTFQVETRGKQVKSDQTGFNITLPGDPVGTVEVVKLFGAGGLNEGAVARVTQGSVAGYTHKNLKIVEKG